VAYCGDRAPKMGSGGHLNSFCYVASSFKSNFVHISLDYMSSVRSWPIYPKTWMMRAAVMTHRPTLCTADLEAYFDFYTI